MMKIISKQEQMEITIEGVTDEILAELESVCCTVLHKVSQIEGCDPEQLTVFFTHNLCERSRTNFMYCNKDGLS